MGKCQPRCRLVPLFSMVYRNGQTPSQESGGENRFEILEGGVLKVRQQHKTNLYINAALWASIEDRWWITRAAASGGPPSSLEWAADAYTDGAGITLPVMAQIDIDYAGRSYTVPSTKETREVLEELGVYAAQGRIEVLTLDGDGFALSLVVGPTIPIAVSYID
jgi:hypothetical protein